MPDFTFYGVREQATTKFYLSLSTWTWSLGIQLQEGSPTFDKVGGQEKTERTQIHFLSDVFVAVASRRWILKSLLGSLNNDDGFFDVLVADVVPNVIKCKQNTDVT